MVKGLIPRSANASRSDRTTFRLVAGLSESRHRRQTGASHPGSHRRSQWLGRTPPRRTLENRDDLIGRKICQVSLTAARKHLRPLLRMNAFERLEADFAGTGVTTGSHPMALIRERLPDVTLASDLPQCRNGQDVRVAGMVICRQRPGTAKGFVFISLEDETGVSNAIVDPRLFERAEAPLLLRNPSSPSRAKSKTRETRP